MVNPVGLRFLPTEEEIVDHYLRLKNHGGSNTSHVDQVISTINICNFDPWELPRKSHEMESKDKVWYFFGRKEKRYNRGERQIRKTKSGFWKKTGVTMDIKRKRSGHREKIGEKRVLVFHSSGSKTNWIMHEYDAACLSPTQNMTYTICKVHKKGEATEISSPGSDIDAHSLSLGTHMNNSGGESSTAASEEPKNPHQLSGFFDKKQETELEEAIHGAFDNLSSYDWKYLLGDDEQSKTSRRESRDQIWYFFGRKENKYNRGERQSRITKSGFWKKTGVTTNIIRKRGNREKIGEKRVLVFHSNSEWVMHEYVSTFLSPTQTTYTVCKVIFKGDPRDLPSSSSAPGGGGGEVEHNHSQFTHMNNSGEFEVGLHLFQSGHRECDNDFICILPFFQGLQNQRHFTGLLDAEKETQIHDALCRGLDSVSTHDLNSFINCGNNDEEEHVNLLFMQENRNDYRPKISLTGFIDHSDDEDSDSDLISATTTVSLILLCFGSSNRRIDQITDLQNSPNSTTKLMSPTQVVRKTSLDASKEKSDVQGNEMGEYYKMDQEVINKKRGSFFYRKIRSCIKKTLLCSSIPPPPPPQEHDN
ncbi:unnamed protein product [Brassica oleracea var. botrytis]